MKIKNQFSDPRTNTIGADFSSLPEEGQEKIMHDLFGVGSQWNFLTDVMNAEPERKIAMFREMKNLTQAQLAKMAGIRQADVSMAEKSVDSVKYKVLRGIAESLNVPLKKILF